MILAVPSRAVPVQLAAQAEPDELLDEEELEEVVGGLVPKFAVKIESSFAVTVAGLDVELFIVQLVLFCDQLRK